MSPSRTLAVSFSASKSSSSSSSMASSFLNISSKSDVPRILSISNPSMSAANTIQSKTQIQLIPSASSTGEVGAVYCEIGSLKGLISSGLHFLRLLRVFFFFFFDFLGSRGPCTIPVTRQSRSLLYLPASDCSAQIGGISNEDPVWTQRNE